MSTFQLTELNPGDCGVLPHQVEQSERLEDDIAALQGILAGATTLSQSTLLLQKRKDMTKIDDMLANTKADYDEKMQACQEKEAVLARNKAALHKNMQKFQRFIQENDRKKQIAENKERTERKAKEELEAELTQLQDELHSLEQEAVDIKAKTAKLLKYREYLEQTVDVSADQYEEIDDILKRHKTLATTNVDLKESLHVETQRLEELRAKLSGAKRESQNVILVQNSEVHNHQRAIEEMRSSTVKVEAQRELDNRSAFSKLREYGQVMMSIKNLHQRCLAKRHRGRPKKAPGGGASSAAGVDPPGDVVLKDLKDKLNYVQMRMMMLQEIKDGQRAWDDMRRDEEALAQLSRSTAQVPK
jgi:chromosome segregation ATPase